MATSTSEMGNGVMSGGAMPAGGMAGGAMPGGSMDSGMMDSNYLTTDGYNLSNATDLLNFWGALLDDSTFIPVDKAYSAYFWYGISIVIAIATFINWSYRFTLSARMRASAVKRPFPAKPDNVYTKFMATMTAIVREVTYPHFTPMWLSRIVTAPPTGIFLLLILYFGFLVGLELVQDFIPGALYYEAFGYRAGWLSTAQMPLLILLVGKQNLLAFLTGISYERLNIFHRWVARSIWLYGTLHWIFMQYAWSTYGVSSLERSMDPAYPTGLAAWGVLTWINLSSIAPLRNWQYEFFVIQHVLSFMGFIVVLILHLPVQYAKIYIYIPIGLFLVDRLIRGAFFAYNNRRLGRAIISPLAGDVSKIRVQDSGLENWSAGQHVLLSIPRFGILQSHPATIASTPTSHNGDLIFILKSHKGFTNRLYKSAISSKQSSWSLKDISGPSPHSPNDSGESGNPQPPKHLALISGPFGFGNTHADFSCFSIAMLIAGSTGVSFTLPLLLNIAERATTRNIPLKHVSFIWIIRSSVFTSWVADELRAAVRRMNKSRVGCDVIVFVTQDGGLADYNNVREKSPGCTCGNINGICYCDGDVPAPLRTQSSKQKRQVAQSVRQIPSRENSGSSSNLMTVRSGRPNLETMIWEMLECAEGESGIAVCGPLSLGMRCRKAVSSISGQRGVHKGTGAQGVYLHVEGFHW
ncbi:hypothetical protein MMC13_001758 [Lambiella insularis]|nr:hypothetical protein [Lambiella insularis]